MWGGWGGGGGLPTMVWIILAWMSSGNVFEIPAGYLKPVNEIGSQAPISIEQAWTDYSGACGVA